MVIKGLLQVTISPGSRSLVAAEHKVGAILRKAWNKIVRTGYVEHLYADPEEKADASQTLEH